ncbi:MAG: hypothetical protein LBR18_08965, partial [Tannerella sp.]|nr:hypothetical protein [Tannerella sp.]
MKKIIFLAFAIILFSCVNNKTADYEQHKDDFRTPPPTMTTGVYWYWMADNISKDGVIKDLQAMKKAGVNSVFIGNIGGSGVQPGKVKIFTDEWWDVLHTAFKTAGELGIEVGMFNCPGWSQAGGPWIKPSQSTRYLVSSETRVKGPGKVSVKLPIPHSASRMGEWSDTDFINNDDEPSPDFQDVKVIAFPVPDDYGLNLFDVPDAKLTMSPDMKPTSEMARRIRYLPHVSDSADIALRYIIPGVKAMRTETESAVATLPQSGSAIITLKLPKAHIARSLTIYPAGLLAAEATLQAKTDGEFRTVKEFTLNRSLPMLHVGHVPYAPVAVAFDETVSDEYRIIFNNTGRSVNGVGKIILSATPVVEEYPEKLLAKLYQGSAPSWDEYQWKQQQATVPSSVVAQPEQVVDLTDKLGKDGMLTWEVPAGEWVILRTGMVPTYVHNSPASLEGTGLEMDKMSRDFIDAQFDGFIGEVMRRIPPADRSTFRVIINDSWEKSGQNFTDRFLDTFKTVYGYDAMPFLPVMTGYVIGNEAISDRFLWDVRRLTADMTATNYVLGLTEKAHQHGLTTWLENYGDWGFPGEFLLYGKYADNIGGEFWEDRYKPYIPVAASSAHIYNKGRVYAEAFTDGGSTFYHHPASLKRFGDAAFAEGMTRAVIHVYIEQPYEELTPGIKSWFGIEFNRKNTWFRQADLFTEYLKRCGVMLERGRNIADAAVFIGENVPVNSGQFEKRERDSKAGEINTTFPAGYHFDYINSDVLLGCRSAGFQPATESSSGVQPATSQGLLTLPHGAAYRLLILPPLETMRPELLQKIEQLIADGVAVLGSPPKTSPSLANYPESDRQVSELAAKLWKSDAKVITYGKGKILQNMSVDEALETLGITPDFQATHEKIVFAHRSETEATRGGGNSHGYAREIYFISNQNDYKVQFEGAFRVSVGLTPELWLPATGEIRPLLVYERRGETTVVPLQLEDSESCFVVFSPSNAVIASAVKQSPNSSSVIASAVKQSQQQERDCFVPRNDEVEISTPWTVTFESDSIKRGPSEPVIFNTLQDWSQSEDDRIRYFSGTAVYKTHFQCPQSLVKKQLSIDLGKVAVMAKVNLNGKYVGGVWTPPYRLNISGNVKEGVNELEIEVVNTWLNRIVGDCQLPPEERRLNYIPRQAP